MKANRSFRQADQAVSPVIAVILMVAITVVLAATVYVWVSGFGSQSSQPAKTISLTSAAALPSGGGLKQYTVASGTAGMKWSDLKITVDGNQFSQNTAAACGSLAAATSWEVCHGTTTEASTDTVDAGDSFYVYSVTSGQTLRVLDSQANSVILTLTIG